MTLKRAFLTLLLIILAGACVPTVLPDPTPLEPTLSITGDSITYLGEYWGCTPDTVGCATSEWNANLPGYQRDIRWMGGKRADEMIPTLEDQLTAHPDRVVIELGTNDMEQSYDWHPAFEQIAALTADRPCVVWVTISEVKDGAAEMNQWMRDLAAANGNVRVYEWWQAVQAAPADPPLRYDPVHVTADGAHLLATGVAATLATCP